MSWILPDDVRVKLQLAGDYKSLVLNDAPVGYWRLGDSEGYAQAVLSDAPVAYWRFEEASGNAVDTSGNAHTVTMPGSGVTYGVAGALANGTKGFSMAGAQARASFTGIAIGTTCSFEFWLTPTAAAALAYRLVFGATGGGAGLYFDTNVNKLNLQVGGGAAGDRFNSTALVNGTLHHIVVSIAAGAATFYVNGVADGAAAGWPGITADSFFNVGGGGAALIAALVDEFALYNYALSAVQVANHYALRASTITAVTTATLADSSGNGNTLATGQGVAMGQAALQPDTNACIAVDGTQSIVSGAGSIGNFGTSDFSVEAWLSQDAPPYPTDPTNPQRIVMGRVGGVGGNGWRLWWHPGFVTFEVFKVATGLWYTTVWLFPTVSYSVWKHVVVVARRATNDLTLYVDGASLGTQTMDAAVVGLSVSGTAGTALTIGNSTFAPNSKWKGKLDEIALYTYALTAAQAAAHYLAGKWTDITADLTDEDLVLDYGIHSNRPEYRCADTGHFSFGLRNGFNNSGGTVGYYSPYSASKRPGFGFGLRTQLAITYSGTTIYWLGRLRTIQPQSDPYLEPVTHCSARDWMDEAAGQNMDATLQQSARSDQVFSAAVAIVPFTPLRTAIDVGSDSYLYAFDNIFNQSKVLSALSDLALSELGYIGQKRDTVVGQTVFFESRHTRPTINTLRVTLTKTMTGLDINGSSDDILNHVRVTVHPRRADSGASTIVAKLDAGSGSPLLPGQSQTFFLNFTDPVQRDTFIGAKAVVTPLVATTDYTMNTAADGSGSDVTASFTVTATVFASSIKIVVTNVGSGAGYVTKLQARGDGVYALNPIIAEAQQASSIASTGNNIADLDMLYQSDPTFAYNVAQYISRIWGTPFANVKAVTFCANQSAAQMSAAVFGEISDKVALVDTVNGLTAAQQFHINAVTLRISQRNRIDCTWQLVPADTTRYWLLGVAGASEDGTTAVLGL